MRITVNSSSISTPSLTLAYRDTNIVFLMYVASINTYCILGINFTSCLHAVQ